jgi:hypothetical protein
MLDPLISSDRSTPSQNARDRFTEILRRLHKAVAQHWPDAKSGRPKKVDPGIVKKIHLSVFGFSRGATQARAFTNWMVALCRLDARLAGRHDTMTLGGFNVNIDFLGLFDSVASVGAGNTFGSSLLGRLFDGHGAWADSEESLRIPEGIPCAHLVAAHELRRSFPLDSIAVGPTMPDNCSEVVFPGVHSDLGCGYSPCEQGRGTDPEGVDMLARVPLVYMYKVARLAGVPLKLELASDTAKKRFMIAPATIVALNDYLALAMKKVGLLHETMREQAHFQMRCRLERRVKGNNPLESTSSFGRASTFD